MKKTALVLSLMFVTQLAQAGTLIITCGKNAYEALENKNLNQAEFVLQLTTRGPNNPPEIARLSDEGQDKMQEVSKLSRNDNGNILIQLRNNGKYEITDVKDCSSIDTGSARVQYSAYLGGFAGYGAPVSAKCSCLDKSL